MSLRIGVNSLLGGHDSCTHENSKRAGDELLSEYNTGRLHGVVVTLGDDRVVGHQFVVG